MSIIDDYTKMIFGQHAVRVPGWLKVQNQGDGVVSFVGSSKNNALRFGSKRVHQLVIGELIIRPQLVVATDIFAGHGLGMLATDASDLQEWAEHGEIVLDPFGQLK